MPDSPTEGAPDVPRKGLHLREYRLPFGRYEGSDRAPAPAHQSMIGRLKQRARLLNLLFTQGRRGAYLITGHRGAGKTTFVEDAIATYRRDVYRRFLRSDVGRSFFWDRLGLLALVTAMVTGMLILKHILSFLLLNETAPRLPGLAAIPILLAFCNPLFIAHGTIDTFIKSLASHWPRESSHTAETQGRSAVARVRLGGSIVLGLQLLILVSPLFVWPWWAHAVALLGATGIFWSVRHEASKVAATALTATAFTIVAVFVAILVARYKGADASKNALWSMALFGVLLGLTSTKARKAFLPVLKNNGAAFAVVGAGLVLVLRRTPISPLLPMAFAALLSSFTSLVRAVHEAVKEPDGREQVRWVRVFFVAVQVVGVLLVPIWLHRPRESLRSMWLPVLLLVLFELAIPHFFASIDTAERRSPARPEADKKAPAKASTEPASSAKRESTETTGRGEWDQWALRIPSALTVLAKVGGLFLLTLDLISPVIRWAEVYLGHLLQTPPDVPSVPRVAADIEWILWIVLFLMTVTRLEYDWILRPAVTEDPAAGKSGDWYTAIVRDVVPRTFFYSIYEAWLPVLKVNVNLGVDGLSHRRVVEVMMTALHEAYHRTFAHWRSPLSALGGTVRVGVVLFFMTLGGSFFFSFHDPTGSLAKGELCAGMKTTVAARYADAPKGPKISHVYDWACSTGRGEDIVRALRFNFLDPSASYRRVTQPAPKHLGDYFVPTSFFERPDGKNGEQVELRTYHLFLVFLLYWFTGILLRRWPILPYQHIEKRLRRVLDSVSSSIDEHATQGWATTQYIPFGPKAEESVIKRTAPLDSRRVEQMFLSVLRDIRFASISLPLTGNLRLNLPAAEVIFVFDELDKASLDRPAARDRRSEEEEGDDDDDEEDGANPDGAQRLASLMALFADMKNILSSGTARFFFVGGRDLHDAWLGDQMARQPLLTRIFDDEVYLPSLLTDGEVRERPPHEPIELYVESQIRRAQSLFPTWIEARQAAWLGIWSQERLHATFERKSRHLAERPALDIEEGTWLAGSQTPNERQSSDERRGRVFWSDFISFLAYRSSGNVKRLRELLEGFLQPRDGAERGAEAGDREHDLVFHDEDIHRIQLLAEIYQGIERVFRGTPMVRDDKIITSLFYISNTLLKFHRHAFNLANFERIDEIVDVYRAPEIRGVIHELLEWWRGSLLRSVHNGVFTYRLRSEIAQEIRLAARMSEEEMAALHFALDESRTLKDLYRSKLEASETTPSAEVAAALGEIHDLDGEYDSARYYYHLATKLLDEKLQVDVRGGYHDLGSEDAFAAVYEVLEAGKGGKRIVARRLAWVSARLRLTLQIGLTYEHQKDHERALIEYRNARGLASVLARATRTRGEPADASDIARRPLRSLQRLLVQPALAEIHAAEKFELSGDVPGDGLEDVLGCLDAGRDNGVLLVRADVFARRGDLNFFRDPAARDRTRSARADYRAALGELCAAPSPQRNRQTANVLSNLADAFLGCADVRETFQRKSLFGVPFDAETIDEKRITAAITTIREHALSADAHRTSAAQGGTEAEWEGPDPARVWGTPELGSAPEGERRSDPLVTATLLSLSAADMAREDGNAWDAALGEQRVADVLSRVLWWGHAVLESGAESLRGPEDRKGTECLVKLADLAVGKAFSWWQASGQSPIPRDKGGGRSRARQWTALLVTACRLRLVALRLSLPSRVYPETRRAIARLWECIPGHSSAGVAEAAVPASWEELDTEVVRPAVETLVAETRTILLELLRAYSYPMLTRLRALALWIEAGVVTAAGGVGAVNLAFATDELIKSERAYRARLLFTPLELGVPLALFAGTVSAGATEDTEMAKEVRTLAIAHLLRAQRQVTRKPAYYLAISDLHYLADDFNEPRIRAGHALQAAARGLAEELVHSLKKGAGP